VTAAAAVSTRFRDGRKLAGLTLGQGAWLLGVDVVHLSGVELERERPSDELLTKMARLYQTTVAWLLGDAPEISAENERLLDYRGDTVMRIIEEFGLGFCLGNVAKYILRHGAKAGLEDLKKARWYLDLEIQSREASK
jgi:transcriptional regulator with XRE-family HTH domain